MSRRSVKVNVAGAEQTGEDGEHDVEAQMPAVAVQRPCGAASALIPRNPQRSFKMPKLNVLFESPSPHIHLGILCQQFLFHITFPLMLPYFIGKYGWIHMYTQAYGPTLMGVINSWIIHAMFVFMVMSWFIYEEITLGDIIFPCVLFVIQRFLVSLKYATLSEAEYRKQMTFASAPLDVHPTKEEILTVTGWGLQLQLISGWMQLSEDAMMYEVQSTAARLGIDVNELAFKVPTMPTHQSSLAYQATVGGLEGNKMMWEKFLTPRTNDVMNPLWKFLNGIGKSVLCEYYAKGDFIRNANGHRSLENYPKENGHYFVPVYDVCLGLVRQSNIEFPTWGIFACMGIGFAVSIYAVFDNADRFQSDRCAYYIFFYMSYVFLSTLLINTFLLFGMSCIHDCLRRLSISVMLEQLIRLSDVDCRISVYNNTRYVNRNPTGIDVDDEGVYRPLYEGFHEFKVPRITLWNIPENYSAWSQCRVIMFNLGRRFRFRIDYYTGVVFVICVLLGAMMMYLMNNQNISNKQEIKTNCLFLTCIFFVICFSLLEILYVILALLCNLEMRRYKTTLAINMLNVRYDMDRLHRVALSQRLLGDIDILEALPADLEDAVEEANFANIYYLSDTLQHCIDAANDVVRACEVSEELFAQRILGVTVERSHLGFILSVFGAFLLVAGNFIFFNSTWLPNLFIS